MRITRERTIKHVFHQTKEGVTFFVVFNLNVYSLKKKVAKEWIFFIVSFFVVQDSHSKYKIKNTLPNFRNTKELQASARPNRCQYQSIEKNELCSETAKSTGPMVENLAENREDLTTEYPKAAPRQLTPQAL